jgi:hypothetical protein
MKQFISIILALLFNAVLLAPALAQLPGAGVQQPPAPTWVVPENILSFGRYLARYIWTLFLILAVIFYLWSAFMYLEARGDEEKIRRARNSLIWGVVAMAVAILAFSIRLLVEALLRSAAYG